MFCYVSFSLYAFYHTELQNTGYQLLLAFSYVVLSLILNREAFNINSQLLTTIMLPITLPAIIFVEPLFAGIYALLIQFLLMYKQNRQRIKLIFNTFAEGLVVTLLAFIAQHVLHVSTYEFTSPIAFLIIILSGVLYSFLTNGLITLAFLLQMKKMDVQIITNFFNVIRTGGITIFLGIINVFIFYYFGIIGIAISTFLMYFIKPVINFQSILSNEMATFTDFVLHMIKLYDPITHAHSERVKKWTVMIAKEMRLPSKQIHELSQAASWHDIGKIEIPSHVINKTGKLTDAEYELVKAHPEIGYKLVKDMHFFKDYIPVIRYHHERMDGKGYPVGLSGKDIPLHARIMCVADSFDAMTSKRSYKKGMTMKEAVEELERCAGTQFDPEIVDVFISSLKKTYGPDFQKWDKQAANY